MVLHILDLDNLPDPKLLREEDEEEEEEEDEEEEEEDEVVEETNEVEEEIVIAKKDNPNEATPMEKCMAIFKSLLLRAMVLYFLLTFLRSGSSNPVSVMMGKNKEVPLPHEQEDMYNETESESVESAEAEL